MTTKFHILELWDELERSVKVGLYKRLYSSEKPFHIYGVYSYPQRYYGVAFEVNHSVRNTLGTFDNLRELKVSLTPDNLLIVLLLDKDKKDIFAALCENLIDYVINITSESKRIKTVLNQLERWKTMFERSNSDGLLVTEQQGLFGELVFLQKCLLQKDANPINVLKSWVGVDAALRDFQCSNWAVEVKTTATNNPQRVTVNGERQLDETLLENLFLFHCSVEISNGNGETLNQKIANIRSLLESNVAALKIFNSKLFEVGYFDDHANKYEHRFYKIRSEYYYRITDNFPRIKESELRGGVSGVKYDIVLAMCNEYLITENQLLNTIQNL